MRDPRAVVAVAHFAQLVGADLVERSLVRRRVVLDRNLRRHAAHRVRAAPVTGLDRELRVRAHARLLHRHLRAIGEHGARIVRLVLDEAEDVVPAAAVESDDAVAQLVQNLVHLERGGDRLDQHRDLDGAVRQCQSARSTRDSTSFQRRASRWLSSFGR